MANCLTLVGMVFLEVDSKSQLLLSLLAVRAVYDGPDEKRQIAAALNRRHA